MSSRIFVRSGSLVGPILMSTKLIRVKLLHVITPSLFSSQFTILNDLNSHMINLANYNNYNDNSRNIFEILGVQISSVRFQKIDRLKRRGIFSRWNSKVAREMGKSRNQRWTILLLICSFILFCNKCIFDNKNGPN